MPSQRNIPTHSIAIIPAAGTSRRMGRPKLLLPWRDGQTVLDAVLVAWQASCVKRVVVVAGELAPQYAAIAKRHGAELLAPDPPPAEMIDSIRRGLEVVEWKGPPRDAVWLVAPADQPRLSTKLVDQLLREHDAAAPSVLMPTDGETRGHPILLPWSARAAALDDPSVQTLRDVVRRFPQRKIDWSDGTSWLDIDTPQDYQRIRELL